MKILVIGGTRFIGAHVVRCLHDAGGEVSVLHQGRTSNPILPEVVHVLDPNAEYPVTKFPRAVRRAWDVVVHMVAMGAADARAAVETFAGSTGRLVLVSSSDVYRAYGRLVQIEPGPPEPVPLVENAPLRSAFYPYRGMEEQLGAYAHDYEKIHAERVLQGASGLDWTILRLPKVYGPQDNGGLDTVYGFAGVPHWRWTHGHVRNVAAAIAMAATHPRGRNAVYNVGEEATPTMGERLARLPKRASGPPGPPRLSISSSLSSSTHRRSAASSPTSMSSTSEQPSARAYIGPDRDCAEVVEAVHRVLLRRRPSACEHYGKAGKSDLR